MKTISDEVVVDASPVETFEFFRSMDEARYLAWHPDHVAFHLLEGDRIEPGARASFEEDIGDERLSSTVRYTEVCAPTYVEFRDESPITRLFNPKNTFTLEATDGITRVTAAVHLRIGPLERLSGRVRRDLEALRRHVREEGENLKRLVEAGEIERGEERA